MNEQERAEMERLREENARWRIEVSTFLYDYQKNIAGMDTEADRAIAFFGENIAMIDQAEDNS